MQLADCDVDDDPVIYMGTLIYPDYSGSGKGWKDVSKGKGGRFYASGSRASRTTAMCQCRGCMRRLRRQQQRGLCSS